MVRALNGAPPPPDLQAAVIGCYRAFAKYKKPVRPLDVCLRCCVSEQIDKQLCEWPLKRLPAGHFYEYNGSAKSDTLRGTLLPDRFCCSYEQRRPPHLTTQPFARRAQSISLTVYENDC